MFCMHGFPGMPTQFCRLVTSVELSLAVFIVWECLVSRHWVLGFGIVVEEKSSELSSTGIDMYFQVVCLMVLD